MSFEVCSAHNKGMLRIWVLRRFAPTYPNRKCRRYKDLKCTHYLT